MSIMYNNPPYSFLIIVVFNIVIISTLFTSSILLDLLIVTHIVSCLLISYAYLICFIIQVSLVQSSSIHSFVYAMITFIVSSIFKAFLNE